jgi:hypothetical protein
LCSLCIEFRLFFVATKYGMGDGPLRHPNAQKNVAIG